jgi:HK97 gp10 family phage protein
MTIAISVTVDKDSIATIKRFPSNIRAEIRKGMVKISKMLQKEARENAPKETGHLAYGGKKKSYYGPGGIFGSVNMSKEVITLTAKAVYAAIVEFGGKTRKYEAQPYLRPTMDENAVAVRDIIEDHMLDAWGKYSKSYY